MSTAFLTDHYELTMVNAARESGRAHRSCVFEVFARRLPEGRRYGVVAGTARLLDAIEDFRFSDEQLAFLSEHSIVSNDTAQWLASYRFGGTIHGYREGDLYFPGSPVLVVEGSFQDAVILETVILSVLNYDSAVASAASRMVQAAADRPLIEMGARRAHEYSAVAAARAAYLAGFGATSNLEAGERYGIPTRGTAAHSFTLVHDSEEEAFRAQVAAMGEGTTLLIDTYNIEEGVSTAIEVAGKNLGAVRIDSGDLATVVTEVRKQLDRLGARNTRIIVTNDLNEHTIASLKGSPVDVFGVGTSVVTGSGAPAAGFVYKLVARTSDSGEWVSVAKKSSHKSNPGGKKTAIRVLQDGKATEEAVVVGDRPDAPAGRSLLIPLLQDGQRVVSTDPATLTEHAREHHLASVQELPSAAFSLQNGDPAIPTRFYPEAL